MARKSKSRKASGTPSPQPLPGGATGNGLRKILVGGVMAGITLYCLLFLMVPFGPVDQQMQRMAPPEHFLRMDFFMRLLDLDYWKFAWFGEADTFSFFAAFRIIVFAGGIAVGASVIGRLILLPFRFAERFTRYERFVFESAIGLSAISSLMLTYGLLGELNLPATRIGLRSGIAAACVAAVFILCRFFRNMGIRKTPIMPDQSKWPTYNWLLLLLAVPSLLMLLLGGILPPVEYDVTSYHVPGAKLFYETGRIGFVSHNVYTNMPFAAEMFYVCGMVLTGDWYLGTLVGKLLIAYCTVLTAIGIYAFGTRLHSSTAGMTGFLLYVSLPWVSWVSTAGLIDGVFGMYLLLAVFALYLAVKSTEFHGKFLYLAGYMAGCAAACKYTAVPFLVLPLGLAALFFAGSRRLPGGGFDVKQAVRTMGFFVLSVTLACGLWYGKNLTATGNPTYPLMYNLFGDRTGTWDATKNARWQAAHASTEYSAQQLVRDAKTVLFGSDWLAPAFIPLAVLPFLRRKQDRVLVALALYLLFYLALWWLLTHRLERFWVPLLPIVALLAGVGAGFRLQTSGFREECHPPSSLTPRPSPLVPRTTIFIALLLTFNTCYTFFPNALSVPGKYSRFGFGVEAARHDPMRVASPVILHFNANPPVGKLLLVGDAEVFDYNVPVLYNTCFDDTPFDAMFFDVNAAPPMLRSPDETRQHLHEAGVSHVIVNWSELARFRSTGNYGYTSNLVQPEVFDRLTQLGVLRQMPDIPTLPGQVVYTVCE
ncbi:MAG: glycosyltransferase family 39 protein [Planctomycetaceae bacterium]|nr:glycosyltransferase family 39 protein [Planctomycetaceae bacterium]